MAPSATLHREEDRTFGGQRLVNRRDEIARRPASARGAPTLVITLTRLERQHFLERLTLIIVVLNEVADDRDHIFVKHHICLIAQPAMPRNDHRTAFGLIGGRRHRDHLIEGDPPSIVPPRATSMIG
jgi:hypothetical protein